MHDAIRVRLSMSAARVNAGLTQKEAAKALKVSNATLCNWEKGRSFPSVLQAVKLCELYGVHWDTIDFCPYVR